MNKGQVKWLIGVVGILGISAVILFMPRFQAVKEVRTTESVSRIYSIIHAYERSQLSNSETFQSLIEGRIAELGKAGGGFDWKDNSPSLKELNETLIENLKTRIDDNGGKHNFFRKIKAKKGAIRTKIRDIDSIRVYPEKNVTTINLSSYISGPVGRGAVSNVQFEKSYTLKEKLPVRYFEAYRKAKEYNESLYKKLTQNPGELEESIKMVNEEFNRKNKPKRFKVETNLRRIDNGILKFAVIDLKNKVPYEKGLKSFMFNVTIEILRPPKAVIYIPSLCKRKVDKKVICSFNGEQSEDRRGIEKRNGGEITLNWKVNGTEKPQWKDWESIPYKIPKQGKTGNVSLTVQDKKNKLEDKILIKIGADVKEVKSGAYKKDKYFHK